MTLIGNSMIFVALPAIVRTVDGANKRARGLPASSNTDSGGRRPETLFLGTVRFKNGGPACSACHSVAGLAFPRGGTMGPDLTRAYSKIGPEGLNSALETLFFPAMTPLFAYRPLTLNERRNLAASSKVLIGNSPAHPLRPSWRFRWPAS